MNRMRQPFVGLASLLAGIYLVLAVFSVSCALDHEPQTSGHHHGGTVSHSSFCAWACQVNPTSDVGPSAIVLHPLHLVALFVERNHTVIACDAGFHAASRAPPAQA